MSKGGFRFFDTLISIGNTAPLARGTKLVLWKKLESESVRSTPVVFLTKQKNKILHKISNIGDFKRVGNVFWKGETHMDQISEKELAALNELLSEEELLIKKFKMLSEHTEDAEVKAKFTEISNKHQEHFQSLYAQLK